MNMTLDYLYLPPSSPHLCSQPQYLLPAEPRLSQLWAFPAHLPRGESGEDFGRVQDNDPGNPTPSQTLGGSPPGLALPICLLPPPRFTASFGLFLLLPSPLFAFSLPFHLSLLLLFFSISSFLCGSLFSIHFHSLWVSSHRMSPPHLSVWLLAHLGSVSGPLWT